MSEYNTAIANPEVMINSLSRDAFFESIKNLPDALPSYCPLVSLECSDSYVQFQFIEITNKGTIVYEFLSTVG